jgi:polysaccharide deacetylase 2 family uncharacterized protein YibQ
LWHSGAPAGVKGTGARRAGGAVVTFACVKPVRRILVILFVVALLGGAGLLTARLFSSGADEAVPDFPRVTLDSAQDVAWRKANAWLFRDGNDTALTQYRERFVLPYAVGNGLGPRAVRKRGAFTELTFPRGKPVHALAYELEQFAPRAGYVVVDGREVGNGENRVEYLLRDAAGQQRAVRLLIGDSVAPGSFRMALVITELGSASEAERRAWAGFPVAVTLVYPDTLKAAGGEREAHEAARDILVELPMEPTNYPVVRPGPRALFIDDSREETEKILARRLQVNEGAVGFATRFGDRAIENPRLMEHVLAFVARRGLLFLDLTGSPRTLTQQAALQTGATAVVAAELAVGSEKVLVEELTRRTRAAQRSGEGLWVLRHTPGLAAAMARAVQAQEDAGTAPRWVTLRQMRGDE